MIKTMLISFIVNLFLVIIKFITGYFGRSSALLADGISSLSDMVTDIFAIISGIFTRKKADYSHPFGYAKFEYIFSLVMSMIIIFLGIYQIIVIDLDVIIYPSIYIFPVISLVIIIKWLIVMYLIKNSKKYNSDILVQSSFESKNDLYGSILVLISSMLMLLVDYVEIFKYANIVATTIISVLIIITGIKMLIFSSSELSAKRFKGTLNRKVKEIILEDKNVEKIKKLYVFKYGLYYQVIGEIYLKKDILLSDAHDILEKLEKELKEINVKYVYLDMDVEVKNEISSKKRK